MILAGVELDEKQEEALSTLAAASPSVEGPKLLRAALICAEHRGAYEALTQEGSEWVELAGRVRHLARHQGHLGTSRLHLPAVGDWVALDGATVTAILPRRSVLVRSAAGTRAEAQVIAANVNVAFIVTSANDDFNPRRLERYVTAARRCPAQPVIVINKIDLHPEVNRLLGEIESLAQSVPVVCVSAQERTGREQLVAWLGPGSIAVFVGMSGVGKSSLVNWLLERDALTTQAIRVRDDRGAHTSTQRRLLALPSGGVLIDTPGMREFGLWHDDEEPIETGAFEDLRALAARCRFNDCTHEREPGCAVRQAIDEGTLDAERWANHRKLLREHAALNARRQHKGNGPVTRPATARRRPEAPSPPGGRPRPKRNKA